MAAKEQTWEEWVQAFNETPTGASAALPAGPGTDVLSGANRANIATLFDPNFGRGEVMTLANENAIAGGWGSGGFAGAQGLKLLDSERKANFLLGAQLLEPYLQRENAASLQASDNAARLNQIVAEGAQALQRLQLSEAGQTARLNSSQASELQRQVLAGQQAMQQLTLREAGETGRQNTAIQGNLASQLVGAALDRSNRAAATPAPPVGGSYYLNNSGLPGGGTPGGPDPRVARPAYAGSVGTLGLGSSSIDALLRKYGLL